jgi:hypothetical protein
MLPCPVCSGSKKSGHRNKFAQVTSSFFSLLFMLFPMISTVNALLWSKKRKEEREKKSRFMVFSLFSKMFLIFLTSIFEKNGCSRKLFASTLPQKQKKLFFRLIQGLSVM